jgi:hypothetical protein
MSRAEFTALPSYRASSLCKGAFVGPSGRRGATQWKELIGQETRKFERRGSLGAHRFAKVLQEARAEGALRS